MKSDKRLVVYASLVKSLNIIIYIVKTSVVSVEKLSSIIVFTRRDYHLSFLCCLGIKRDVDCFLTYIATSRSVLRILVFVSGWTNRFW